MPRSLLSGSWIFFSAILPLAAQNSQPSPALPGIGENVVKSETPPPGLVQSAVDAVEKLGTQVVAGNYKIAIDLMYPNWKERMAKRAGGMDKLEAQLAKAPEMLQRSGVVLLSFKPQGEARVFEAVIGKKAGTVGGRQVESMVYTKWLVFVPTATRMKVAKDGKSHLIESLSYQVAISDKGKNEWTFMDGSSIGMADLRSMFPTLPEIKLPEVGGHEIPQAP